MRAIHKWPLKIIDGIQVINLPISYKFRSLIEQNGVPTLYFEVDVPDDLESPTEVKPYGFQVFGTGHDVSSVCEPIGPYANSGEEFLGSIRTSFFVWHVFMLGEIDTKPAGEIPF